MLRDQRLRHREQFDLDLHIVGDDAAAKPAAGARHLSQPVRHESARHALRRCQGLPFLGEQAHDRILQLLRAVAVDQGAEPLADRALNGGDLGLT